ncbi:folate-binding protein YgfZ [Rhodobacteraceae bacterium WD3A24]|nr:folate-binding protein YgfZ [Rhodobacteraceae bacterium WD3A24]
MEAERADDREILDIAGEDRAEFLQGLVTNDIHPLEEDGGGIVYTAILTPQGKYLADFFVVALADGRWLIDVHESLAEGLVKRLNLYKLRADVTVAPSELKVGRGLGPAPEGALSDPRHPSLGWRLYAPTPGRAPETDWEALRIAACVPESGVELIPGETFILEAGFERLNGVDHRKGCYVGQEVTARMKHKTELRKGLATVRVAGAAEPGTEIVNAQGKAAGRLFSQAGGQGIAHLRYDRATGAMQAGDAVVERAG